MKTIKIFLLVFGIIIMLISGCSSGNYPPLDVVDSVDVQKYLGKWYEIARLPNSFQDDCYGSTAEYELIDSSTLRVINSCNEDSIDGEIDQVMGKAFIVENTNNAKLKVQFFWPFKGDYWIIALDQQDYSYALVGTPSRKYLWLLARDKDFGGEEFDNLIKIAAAKGFDTSKLIIRDKPVNQQL